MSGTDLGRAIGFDIGRRRTGVAVSDTRRALATGIGHIARQSGPDHQVRSDHQVAPDLAYTAELLRLISEHEATVIVVGLPLSLDGSVGPAAQGVLAEVEELRHALRRAEMDVEVVTHDERFTTVVAAAALRSSGRKSGSKRARQDRRLVDQVAAAVMLQSWLEQTGTAPEVCDNRQSSNYLGGDTEGMG